MVGYETSLVTRINEIESCVHLTHCHSHALQLAVGETIEAIKIMKNSLSPGFELYKLIIFLRFQNFRKKVKYFPKRERNFLVIEHDAYSVRCQNLYKTS